MTFLTRDTQVDNGQRMMVVLLMTLALSQVKRIYN